MLYVIESDFERKIFMLNEFSKKESCDLVVWLYPESFLSKLLGVPFELYYEENLESVTTYGNNANVRRSYRLQLDQGLVNKIVMNKELCSKNVDSFCLYYKRKLSWNVCTIGHEGVCLVKDYGMYEFLRKLGYSVSKKPPVWW